MAILREESELESQAVYERAMRAIVETAASGAKHGSETHEDTVERWMQDVRSSGSLYLALGEAIAWLRRDGDEWWEEAEEALTAALL